eukprot:TRINITY_DN14830_c0_g1_i1.p1 TRINITY_DN14830_c0_g1~~TRINITY_DN14830_c0_g1_i1.p1  ORF type:complete len:102 (+),score=10.84 TRINITY_DN14830_c0_g1_i1:45-308(+)
MSAKTQGEKYGVPSWHSGSLKVEVPERKRRGPVGFVRQLYMKYKVITAIYMLEPWEEWLLNLVVCLCLWTSYELIKALVNTLSAIVA